MNLTKPPHIIKADNIKINIVRTRRQDSMALNIRNGEVRVLVPKRTHHAVIESFVAEKFDWINENLKKQAIQPTVQAKQYIEGESFLFLGVERTLKLVTGARKNIVLDDDSIRIYSSKSLASSTIKNRLKKWMQTQAQLYLAKRTKTFAALLVVSPKLINTRSYKARWGCCSNKKEITYNWQIIMAPEHIIDYVIVHELCHIKEHNHSPAFWSHVENLMPDYKERKKWLDKNGHTIQF